MLLNLTKHASFPCKSPSFAIYCSKDLGPSFGLFSVLKAREEPFNKENACYSMPSDTTYNVPYNIEGINMFTNMKCTNDPAFQRS
jgi:hypothetical protein